MTTLTPSQLEVVQAMANGYTHNTELVEHLHKSVNTIKTHLKEINKKLGTSSRTSAVVVAIQQGLVTLPTPEDTMAL